MNDRSGSSSLSSACALARVTLGAAAVSVAMVHDDGLRYVAADGAGADEIVGTHLPPGSGIAGFVAATGQSLSVRDPASDPRFAREVGERTGYVPAAMQCVAVPDDDGDVAAVLSVLDRGVTTPIDEAIGATRAIELVIDIVATLIRPGDGDDRDIGGRLAGLPAVDRARARAVVTAVLDAFES